MFEAQATFVARLIWLWRAAFFAFGSAYAETAERNRSCRVAI